MKDIRGIESKIILHYNRGILDENEPSIFSILDIGLKKYYWRSKFYFSIISTYFLPIYFSNFFLWYSRKW